MRTRYLFLFFFLLFVNTTFSQDIATFFQNEQSLMREKLYLHTDKPYYAAGDTIWYRGTLLNADTHSFLVHTNYIYVELYTKNDSLVSRQKLKRDGLCFHNCIPLEADLPEGEYLLRGYTEWMRNFDDAFFAQKELSIINALEKGKKNAIKSHDYTITFLPEGGALLGGVRQRISFITQRSDGHSEEVEGTIQTEQGEIIGRFTTRHNGMGIVTCDVPRQGRLIAKTTSLADGLERQFPLPEIASIGSALKVENRGNNLLYIDCLTNGNTKEGLHIVTHAKSICTDAFSYTGDTTLCTREWPSGINHILLCNKEGDVLSRRLVFIDNGIQAIRWTTKTERPTYDKREKVRIDLQLNEGGGNPLLSDFSVSVTDASTITPDTLCDNIVSSLLLTSELKGRIENPAWYFKPGSDKKEELDLVMLTHGWSRFETDNLNTPNKYALPYYVEKTQYISGRVEGIPEKEKNNLIGVYNPDERQFASGTVQSDGTFCLDGLDFVDSTYFGVRLLSKKKMHRKIFFDKPTYPEANYKNQDFLVSLQKATEARKNYLKGEESTIYLPSVWVKEKKKSLIESASFYIHSLSLRELQQSYDPNEIITLSDLLHHMMTTTHEGMFFPAGTVNIYDGLVNPGGYSVWGRLMFLYTSNGSGYSGADIAEMLRRINLYDVDRVEFIPNFVHSYNERDSERKKEYYEFDDKGTYSAMFVRFKKGHEFRSSAPDPRKHIIWPKGYEQNAYFYHPVYSTEEQRNNSVEDKRTTLYWNPSVQTDKKGEASIVFYTSDSPNNYTLTIEGVTIGGEPVYLQQKLF